jgi:hypothetical protein
MCWARLDEKILDTKVDKRWDMTLSLMFRSSDRIDVYNLVSMSLLSKF